jgi:EpsD family peptidyl-prolyl cis-trans isomerase
MKRRACCAFAAVLLLSACEQPAPPAESIAAKVGNTAITQAEVDTAVDRLGPVGDAERAEARSKVLNALIDQHLVSQAARQDKLDQRPEVALAMTQAQRQVLVEAYMERLFGTVAAPTEAEVRDYYARHPELFGARKVYRVQELALRVPPSRLADVKAQLTRSTTLADFATWLKDQGIEARAGATVRPAEQIPAAVLDALVKMQNGHVALVQTGGDGVSVVQLQGSELQPVTLEQARRAIETVLQGEKRKTLLESELSRLRSTGKIEYATGYTPAAPTASAPSPQPSE